MEIEGFRISPKNTETRKDLLNKYETGHEHSNIMSLRHQLLFNLSLPGGSQMLGVRTVVEQESKIGTVQPKEGQLAANISIQLEK